MIYAFIASALLLAVYLWQDRYYMCGDGDRYTSMKRQPHPFHRRFTYWPKKLLMPLTWASFIGLGFAMGDWKRAVLLLALPGAWFCVTHPTCVDAPLMLLAWMSARLLPTHPVISVGLALLCGVIHERGPVFAAVYAFSPWPLLGLLAVQWWRKPAVKDSDVLVGHGTIGAIKAHHAYQDFLDGKIVLIGLRAVLPMAVYYGVGLRAWAALALAMATRIIGTDTCRFLFWAAPPLIADLPDVPAWVVALHAVSFRRAI